ncbi:hypothetical protein [Hymenobacter negativus]|nr:hypothetical protein [Hymenobacter negativus]
MLPELVAQIIRSVMPITGIGALHESAPNFPDDGQVGWPSHG